MFILSNHFILVRIVVNLEPILGTLEVRWEYTLVMPTIVGHHAHSFAPSGNIA